jgi:hypothetical protein
VSSIPLPQPQSEDSTQKDQETSNGSVNAPKSVIEDVTNQYDIEKQFPEFPGWESIGFHRGLGREFWQLILEMIGLVGSIFLLSLLMPILNPYPQIRGYQDISGGLFAMVYMIFDLGTNFGLGRFIAEFRMKNVDKMLQYVSFTIWWQSFTGLIQVTVLSWFSFQVIVNSEYSYLTWILLIGLVKQYPGWLGIFRQVLEGMQHYDKVEILNFLQSQVVERGLVIGFVLGFGYYGSVNPEWGILMGIILGTIIGNFLDDVMFEVVAAYYLNRIMKKYYGLTIRDAFKIGYDKDTLRNIFFYSAQSAFIPFLSSAATTYVFFALLENINGYATWTALIATGMSFAGQIRQFKDMSLQNSIAEAYPSGKKKLSEFYVSYSIKWRYLFSLLIATIIVGIIPYFFSMVKSLRAFEFYQGAEMFILAGVFARISEPFLQLPDAIMNGARHITAFNITRVIQEILNIVFTYYFVIVLRVQETWGIFGLVFLLGFKNWVPWIIKTILCYIYIEKRILHVKIYWFTSFILPIVASLPHILIARIWYVIAFIPMKAALGLEVTLAISVSLLFGVILLSYFPLIALFGGFDDYQMFVFKKAVDLSGPSKPIFIFIQKIMDKSVKLSKKIGLHGRFPIPHEDAHREVRELMELKRSVFKVPTQQ